MPIDMTRIKANVAKMASMNAPQEDIDGYIASEGTNVEAVRAFNQPQYQGGANSPALVKAKEDVSKLQGQNTNLDTQSGIVNAAANATWPVSLMMQKGITGTDARPSTDSGGSRMVSDMGMVANPLTGEALKAAGKVIGVGTKAIGDVIKYAKPKAQSTLAEEVQNSLLQSKHNVINNYGKEYENIIGNSDEKINISPAIKNFVDEGQSIMQNPEFAQQIASKNPAANKILDLVKTVTNEKVPEELSAKEADSLSKSIKNLPGIKSKLQQASKYGFHTVQWTNEDRMLLGLADDIKSGVIDAHPELSILNKDYGNFMNAYKRVSPDFKIGSTISKLKNYNSYDPQKRQLLEGIIPKDTTNKIKDFNRATITGELLKKLGIGAASAAGIGAAGLEGVKLGEKYLPH